jgi:hypothetical protein
MGLNSMSERDPQRIGILSKVIADRMTLVLAGRVKRRLRNNASSSEFA